MRGHTAALQFISHVYDFNWNSESQIQHELKAQKFQHKMVENENIELQYASTENFKKFMLEIKGNYDDEFHQVKIHHDRVCREIITKVEKEYNFQVKKMDLMLHNFFEAINKNKQQVQIITKKEKQIKTMDQKIEELQRIIKKKKRRIKRQNKEIDKWIQMKIEDIQIEDFRKKNQDFTKNENRKNS